MVWTESFIPVTYVKAVCVKKILGQKSLVFLFASVCLLLLLLSNPKEPPIITVEITAETRLYAEQPSWVPPSPENITSHAPRRYCDYTYPPDPRTAAMLDDSKAWERCPPTEFTVHPPVFPGRPKTITEMPCPPYLPNFRSPCWLEELTTAYPYAHNPMTTNFLLPNKNLPELFQNLTNHWHHQIASGRSYRLRCLPSVYLAGVLKCGTSALWYHLTKHPDIQPALVKEPHWWSHYWESSKEKYIAGQNMSNYLDMFDKAAIDLQRHPIPTGCPTPYYPGVVVDGSAWTFSGDFTWRFYPENRGAKEPRVLSHHFIKRLTPEAKIIVILRNPTERLYSEYLYLRRNDEIKPNPERFHEYVMNKSRQFHNDSLCRDHIGFTCLYKYAGLLTSVYHPFLKEWMSVFPMEQLFIIHYEEEFSKDPLSVVNKIVDFLGLDPLSEPITASIRSDVMVNTNKYKNPMLNATKDFLNAFYRPHNDILAELLGDDRFAWRYHMDLWV